MKICPKCGKQNRNNSKYCGSCGLNLSGNGGSRGGKNKLNIATGEKALSVAVILIAAILIIGGVLLLYRSRTRTENNGKDYTDWSPGQPDNYSAIDQAPQGYLVFSIEYDAWDDQQEKGASAGPTSVAEGAAGYICEWDYDMEKTE